MVPCLASCCIIQSVFFAYPACVGMSGHGSCLCLSTEYKCLKLTNDTRLPGTAGHDDLCICQEFKSTLKKPADPRIKCVNQCWCIDTRCGLPCDEEVPNMCTIIYFTPCFLFKPKVGCCSTIGDLRNSIFYNLVSKPVSAVAARASSPLRSK